MVASIITLILETKGLKDWEGWQLAQSYTASYSYVNDKPPHCRMHSSNHCGNMTPRVWSTTTVQSKQGFYPDSPEEQPSVQRGEKLVQNNTVAAKSDKGEKEI